MTDRLVPAGAFSTGGPVVPGQAVALRASTCSGCGRAEFPPRAACPACGSAAALTELPTAGRLCAFTSVLHPPPGALVEVPYHVGVAELGGVLRVLGLLDGPAAALAVGLTVETVAHRVSGDLVTYAFRLA